MITWFFSSAVIIKSDNVRRMRSKSNLRFLLSCDSTGASYCGQRSQKTIQIRKKKIYIRCTGNIFLIKTGITTHRWQRIIPDHSIHNGRGIGRTGDRFRVGRDREQMVQILFERPRFGIDLFQQRVMAAELSRQGGDGIGEMGKGWVEAVRDVGCLGGIVGRLAVERGERAGSCL